MHKSETPFELNQNRRSNKIGIVIRIHRNMHSYSLNLNYMSINGKIISPNEHESHHAYDLIYNALMLADWYCGDTHSINQLMSSLLHLLSRKFTPHIKKIVDKA